MMPQALEDGLARSMARRSMAALGLLATLVVGSLVLFWLQTRALESAARVLNTSGRQRMISQRTALLADALLRAESDLERERLRRELAELAERLQSAHRGLLQGDPGLGLPSAPAAVVELYLSPPHRLEERMRAYLAALDALVADPAPTAESPAFRTVSEIAVRGTLLAALDAVAGAFQAHEEAQISRLQRAKAAVFALTLAVILLTSRFVILPMVASVRRQVLELRQHHERLAHVSRLSTMGEMTAGIAHEINQPLTAVSSYAQACRRLIEAGRAGSEEVLDTLDKIDRQAHRAGEVIRRVRSLAERRTHERRIEDLNEVVRDAVELAAADARFCDYRLELELGRDLPRVDVDAVQIQQVVLNLIRNSVEALPPQRVDHPIVVATRFAGPEHVEVTVIDHGVGLPAGESPERLFQPFATTKPAGTGLGLSLSRSIAAAHGGRLWLVPRPEGGVVAHLVLPVAAVQTRS